MIPLKVLMPLSKAPTLGGPADILHRLIPEVELPHSLKFLLKSLLKLIKAYPQYFVILAFLAAIGIVIGIVFAVRKGRERKLRKAALFKPVGKLMPEDLEIEKYQDENRYVQRESDDALLRLLEEGEKRILILGKSRMGKTRTAFEAMRTMEDFYILVPGGGYFSQKKLKFPGLSQKRLFLFLDDLYKYAGKDIEGLIARLEKACGELVVIATCRTEEELLQKGASSLLGQFKPENRIRLRELLPQQEESLAKALGKPWAPGMYDGRPGTLCLNFEDMKGRYKGSNDKRVVLQCLKLLRSHAIFIYREALVKKVCEQVFEKPFSRSQWNSTIDWLVENGLITRRGGLLKTYEGYVEDDFVDDYSPAEADSEALEGVLTQDRDAEGLFSAATSYMARGLLDRVAETLEKVVKLNPRHSEAYGILGAIYEKSGLWEKAVPAYNEVVRISPKDGKAHYQLGAAYYKQYMIREAVTELKKAIKIEPNRAEAHYFLGAAYERSGMLDEAVLEFREAVRINPDHIEAHYRLASIYDGRKFLEEAMSEYKQIVRINPGDARARYNLAMAYNKKGMPFEALSELINVVEINPDDARARYYLALAYYKRGMLEEAVHELKEVVRINPNDAQAHYNLGLAYSKKNQLEEAIAHYKEVLRIKPLEPGAHYNLGLAYQKKGMLDEAVGEFREVIRLMPRHAAAHGYLAVTYQKKGLLTEAKKEFNIYDRLKRH